MRKITKLLLLPFISFFTVSCNAATNNAASTPLKKVEEGIGRLFEDMKFDSYTKTSGEMGFEVKETLTSLHKDDNRFLQYEFVFENSSATLKIAKDSLDATRFSASLTMEDNNFSPDNDVLVPYLAFQTITNAKPLDEITYVYNSNSVVTWVEDEEKVSRKNGSNYINLYHNGSMSMSLNYKLNDYYSLIF